MFSILYKLVVLAFDLGMNDWRSKSTLDSLLTDVIDIELVVIDGYLC